MNLYYFQSYFVLSQRLTVNGVLKSQKKSRSTLRAKRATLTFWVDKSSLKMPKMVNLGDLLKTWSLRSNSVTRQVKFNRTKIGEKCQNSKIQMRHFEWFSNNVTLAKDFWRKKMWSYNVSSSNYLKKPGRFSFREWSKS